jgi:hypothetical protein
MSTVNLTPTVLCGTTSEYEILANSCSLGDIAILEGIITLLPDGIHDILHPEEGLSVKGSVLRLRVLKLEDRAKILVISPTIY